MHLNIRPSLLLKIYSDMHSDIHAIVHSILHSIMHSIIHAYMNTLTPPRKNPHARIIVIIPLTYTENFYKACYTLRYIRYYIDIINY